MGVENLYLFPPKVVYPIGVLIGVLLDSSYSCNSPDLKLPSGIDMFSFADSALPGVVQMGEESTEGVQFSSHCEDAEIYRNK